MAKRRILIVDDEEAILDVCALILQDLPDTEITLEQHSPRAVERLRTEHFDLLLTDINMPEVNGIELLRSARQHHPRLIVLMFTGLPNMETMAESMKLGAVDYLTKPFVPRDLLATVNRLLLQVDSAQEPCQQP